MYAVSVVFVIKDEQIEPFRKLIRHHAARTLDREEACREFDVGFDADDPTRVFLFELYDHREAFDAHLKSDYLAEFFATATDWIVSKESNRWDIAAPLSATDRNGEA